MASPPLIRIPQRAARPTAVNLCWALERMKSFARANLDNDNTLYVILDNNQTPDETFAFLADSNLGSPQVPEPLIFGGTVARTC